MAVEDEVLLPGLMVSSCSIAKNAAHLSLINGYGITMNAMLDRLVDAATQTDATSTSSPPT